MNPERRTAEMGFQIHTLPGESLIRCRHCGAHDNDFDLILDQDGLVCQGCTWFWSNVRVG